ncbi:hypothetical protein V2I01_32085 [Micromonospora sp. BRA006-A]|nr:hypothetical protein [Micromonospora sp. BRA006-A]
MVVPRSVASQLGDGLVRSVPSKAVAGGIHGDILGKTGIVQKATFVPVAADASRPGVTGAVSGTAKAATTAGIVTAAASFILLAVATAASVYAEEQRRKAMERVTELRRADRREPRRGTRPPPRRDGSRRTGDGPPRQG